MSVSKSSKGKSAPAPPAPPGGRARRARRGRASAPRMLRARTARANGACAGGRRRPQLARWLAAAVEHPSASGVGAPRQEIAASRAQKWGGKAEGGWKQKGDRKARFVLPVVHHCAEAPCNLSGLAGSYSRTSVAGALAPAMPPDREATPTTSSGSWSSSMQAPGVVRGDINFSWVCSDFPATDAGTLGSIWALGCLSSIHGLALSHSW